MSIIGVEIEAVAVSGGDGAEQFDLEALFARFREWYRHDYDHCVAWRRRAREEYDMVAGHQWDDRDVAYLRDQNRVPVTFNRTGPMVKIVCGLEVGNRQETRFIPREIGDVAVNEILTEAVRWVRDECDAEDEESDAFFDLVVSGMGWTDTSLAYDENPDGKLMIERIDPMEMLWDGSAKKKNLSDSRRLWRIKDVPIYEAREMYPDAADNDLHADWAADENAERQPHDATEAPFYRTNQSPERDAGRKAVRMVEVQWWELVTTWRLVDPFTGQAVSLGAAEMEILRERLATMGMPEPMAVRQRMRVYWRAMLGSKVLGVWRGPTQGGFTWKCMTGERDRNKGLWFGIVRAMMDPQRWANKWLSQSMHILNTGAKGGVMAEAGAFTDIRQAEEDWASSDRIIEVALGALEKGKIQPRPPTPMPQGLAELLTLAISSIRDCTGINLELLGLVERDQPGIIEYQRKQAGMTVLASLFDALRRYRKDQGQLMLWYITNFISDGRLIRIGGADSMRYVPLVKQSGVAEYDVIVDETPTSPNLKERIWATLMQMMPFMANASVPAQVYLELLKYSPLPATVTSKIANLIENQPQQPDPTQIIAETQAKLAVSRANLYDAQTQKAMAEAAMSGQQAEAEAAQTQLEARKTALEGEEIKARIEQLRSAALVNIAKAGATQIDARTAQLLAVLDVLDTLNGSAQQAAA